MFNLKSTFSVFALSSALLAAPMVSQANDVSPITVSGKHMGQYHKVGNKGHHRAWSQLNLSEEQKDKLFELRHAKAPLMRNMHKDVKAARAELRTLSQAEKFDETKAKAASENYAKAQAELAFNRAKFQSETYALLTPEQRKTLNEFKSKRDTKAKKSQ